MKAPRSPLDGILRLICRASARRPVVWLAAAAGLCLLSLAGVRRIGVDTDLIRLLPESSRAAAWTRALGRSVSDGGYFTVILQNEDKEKLLRAVQSTAARIEKVPGVRSVEYRYPTDFIRHYRYLLVPLDYLDRIYGHVLGLEAEYSPFAENLLGEKKKSTEPSGKDGEELKKLIAQYANLSEYHQSRDGTIMGIFVRPGDGFTNLRATQALYSDLKKTAGETGRDFGIWTAIGGSQINNLREYSVVISDLGRSGLISTIAILLTLFFGFRSLSVMPVLLFPLGAGMLWAFACVPFIFGDLNTISAFLLVIVFGVADDYSIHLVKRFQFELASKEAPAALETVYLSTGKSVILSALTTALPLFIMGLSGFRGIAEFGIIGGWAILVLLAAMLLVMPAALMLGHRIGWVKARAEARARLFMPSRALIVILAIFAAAAAGAALAGLRFDYDFDHLGASVPQSEILKVRHREVYPASMSPGALYVASDLVSLDSLRALFQDRIKTEGSTISRVSSIRDFAPDERETSDRLELIALIKEELAGGWVERIEDEEIREWIRDFRDWQPVTRPPSVAELPPTLTRGLVTRDATGRYILGVYPNIPRRNGREAMRFTRELYDLSVSESIQGPVGEMPVFAEILWLVTGEGPLIIAATLLGVILIVFFSNRSIKETGGTVFPLLSGMALALGLMAVFGLRLNFFNIVVIPTLLGLGVDNGVHYYRRWKELGRNAVEAQRELFGPMSTCTLTTMMGYSGMAFARHEGLRSIGLIACLGLAAIWLTSLVLFPGILNWASRKRARQQG